MLAYLVRCARAGARFVRYQGIRFPIRHGFILTKAYCPETGVGLVGVVG